MLPQVQLWHSQEGRVLTLRFTAYRTYLNSSWTAFLLLCHGVDSGFEAHVTLRLGKYPFRAWCYHLGGLVLQHWVCTSSKRETHTALWVLWPCRVSCLAKSPVWVVP